MAVGIDSGRVMKYNVMALSIVLQGDINLDLAQGYDDGDGGFIELSRSAVVIPKADKDAMLAQMPTAGLTRMQDLQGMLSGYLVSHGIIIHDS